MKISTITTVLASAATAGAVGIVNAPIAAAEDATSSSLGTQEKLVDGNVIQGWTISNLIELVQVGASWISLNGAD